MATRENVTLRHRLFHYAKDRVGQSRLRRAVVGAICGLRRAVGIQEHAKQIVICGYPRSGTSLLLNMMSSSLDGFEFAPNERSAKTMLLKTRDCASKWPNDVFTVAELSKLNIRRKRLYIILVVRDLRDIITSIHANVPDRYYCNFDSRWTPSISDPSRPVLTDNGIRRIHDAITRAELIGTNDLLLSTARVRYEDIVTQCNQVQENLAAFLDVEFARKFSDFHLYTNKHAFTYVNPQDASLVRENKAVGFSRLGKWRQQQHRNRIRDQFLAHPELFDLLNFYGHESNDEWFKAYESRTH